MQKIQSVQTAQLTQSTMSPADWSRVTQSLIAYSKAVEKSREGRTEEPTSPSDK